MGRFLLLRFDGSFPFFNLSFTLLVRTISSFSTPLRRGLRILPIRGGLRSLLILDDLPTVRGVLKFIMLMDACCVLKPFNARSASSTTSGTKRSSPLKEPALSLRRSSSLTFLGRSRMSASLIRVNWLLPTLHLWPIVLW